jgi:hypothetical protein
MQDTLERPTPAHPHYSAVTAMQVAGLPQRGYVSYKHEFGVGEVEGKWVAWSARDIAVLACMKHLKAGGYRLDVAHRYAVEAMAGFYDAEVLPAFRSPWRPEAPHLTVIVDVDAIRRQVVAGLEEHAPVDMDHNKRVAASG